MRRARQRTASAKQPRGKDLPKGWLIGLLVLCVVLIPLLVVLALRASNPRLRNPYLRHILPAVQEPPKPVDGYPMPRGHADRG